MMADVIQLVPQPTTQERYEHFKSNAEAFVESMRAMVAAQTREGNQDLAIKLKVWCLMPWEAALRDDASGDLWPTCEVCGKPIKNDDELVLGGECDLHRACCDQ